MSSLSSKFVNQLKHRSQEAFSYILNYSKKLKPSGSVRVVIFAQGRTGSTLLESLLCSTGHFRQNGELLDTSQGEVFFPLQFINGISKWKSEENFIFHLKIYQLVRDRKRPLDPTFFLETLYQDGWKIIYLRRRNKIKHALSNVVVKNRGARHQLDTWHKFNDDKEELNVFIDCERFVRKVEKRLRFDAYEKKVLANIEYHEVIYEDDLEQFTSHQRTVAKILEYLSLEPREAFTKHRKVNNLLLEQLISNYEEFVDCLSKQGWENFLE